jgi:hypothetical protein
MTSTSGSSGISDTPAGSGTGTRGELRQIWLDAWLHIRLGSEKKEKLPFCKGAPRCAPNLRADTRVRPYTKKVTGLIAAWYQGGNLGWQKVGRLFPAAPG